MDRDHCTIAVLILSIIGIGSLPFIESNKGYLVVAPSAFRPDTEEVLSVTILEPSEPIYVEAKLYSKAGELITEAGHEIFGKGTIQLKIPRGTKGRCNLKICGNCIGPREGSYTFYNSTPVIVEEKGTSVFIQMDKPIYKPGQTAFINILITGPDLRPVNENLLLYIEDPRGSRMMQWKDISPLCCGLINVSYPISDQPVLGEWTVISILQGQTYNKSFEIQKYVLPKFEVTIDTPRFIREWKKCEIIYARARYTYGKDVEGQLSISATVKGVGYYKDFIGLTTAITTEIRGVAGFNICVQDLMPTSVAEHFRGILHVEALVTTPDGRSAKSIDDSCPINRQLIDLEFSKDTRRHFKPGLPFKGKLLVTYPDESPAGNVTIRVQADVNGKNFIARDYISENGKINFDIPNLPTMARSVWLDAKVMKIGDEPVHEMYLPTYMSISSWYSPSKCHVLIDTNTDTLSVGNEAKFFVHSTCACNFTMFHEVMARGNLVHSGIHYARTIRKKRVVQFETELPGGIRFDDDIPKEHEVDGLKICTIFVKFHVIPEMAPLSRLLVYYVKESGEGVADSLMFNVKPSFRNKISVHLSNRKSLPSEFVQVKVRTTPSSHVCLNAVDRSVHILRPDYQLSTKEIFSELRTYDLTLEEEADHELHMWPQGGRRKRSAYWWHETHARDAQFAFEECGLLVMTDKVRLLFRQDPGAYTGPLFHRPGPGYYQIASFTGNTQNNKNHFRKKKRRSFFPETWIWTCFNMSSEDERQSVLVKAPDSITTWQLEGISIHPTEGLALAEPFHLRTFKHFFIDFHLPYSVFRGEQVKIPLTIYNYLHRCVRVYVKMKVPQGIDFVPGQDGLYFRKLCVGYEESKTISSVFMFSELGNLKVVAEAEAYADSRCCSGVLIDTPPGRKRVAHDSIEQQIMCQPEGIPKFYTHSVFFCPNERIHLSTPNKYEFQYLKKIPHVTSLTFSAKANNDVRIALSKDPQDNEEMYEVVIGGWTNSHSWIAKGKEGEKLVDEESKDIVSNEEFRTFCLSWHNGNIEVGYGEELDNNSVFLTYKVNDTMTVNYIGFSTGWGADGEFKIWRKEDMGNSYGEVFHLGIPQNFVPGSERAVAKIVGDVMGPTLHNLDKLIHLPYGCGEQNMIHFAPNVFVLRYFDRTNQLESDLQGRTLEFLVKGYQRQLTYRRYDGSYSAFGNRDSTGNMWLTAFVLRSFAQAREFIYIDEKELLYSMGWIISHQRKDGSFPSTGRLINKDIQGGVQGKVALTAYVVTALLEAGVDGKSEKKALDNGGRFLENIAEHVTDPYTVALTAYALTLLKREKAGILLKKLNQMATKTDGYLYWKYHGALVPEVIMKDSEQDIKVSSAEVEIAGYALLTMATHGDVASALPIVKWLTQQRNALGGFHSTQDTCVALQALSEYASLSYSGSVNLTISLASTNMDLQEKFEINQANSDILQTATIPTIPTGLFVSAEGEGCALLQIDVNYNIPDPSKSPSFSLDVRLGRRREINSTRKTDDKKVKEPIEELKVTIEICTRWLHQNSSNMAVMEVSLLTGFKSDIQSLENLLQQPQLKLKRYELEERKIIFYFDEIRCGCLTCLSFEAIRKYVVGKTQPASVRIYDYYEPGYECSEFYNASHIGSLTQELCEDKACNEIREHIEPPESDEDCNSIYGCYAFHAKGLELCTCYRDCPESNSKVCGSDSIIYESLCHMEVQACEKDIYLENMPLEYCTTELYEGSGETSGEEIKEEITTWMSLTTNSDLPLWENMTMPLQIYNTTTGANNSWEYINSTDLPTTMNDADIMHSLSDSINITTDPSDDENIKTIKADFNVTYTENEDNSEIVNSAIKVWLHMNDTLISNDTTLSNSSQSDINTELTVVNTTEQAQNKLPKDPDDSSLDTGQE